jgi:hypothetical protein
MGLTAPVAGVSIQSGRDLVRGAPHFGNSGGPHEPDSESVMPIEPEQR